MSDLVVVVTGASSGIGRATALRFARKGAAVVLAARDPESLEEVAAQIRGRKGGRVLAVPTDVRQDAAVDALARQAIETFGRIDVWVNDAGVTSFGLFEETPPDVFRAVIETNLMGYVAGARAALRWFRRQTYGVLINVASVVTDLPQPYTAAYATSKSAIRAFSRCLRQEALVRGDHDIHVVTVLPPSVDTPIFQHAANYTGREVIPIPPIETAERCARRIVRAARRPRPEVTIGGGKIKAILGFARRHPQFIEHRMAWKTESQQLGASGVPSSSGNVMHPTSPEQVRGGWRRTSVKPLAAAAVLATGAAVVATAVAPTRPVAAQADNRAPEPTRPSK